MINSLAILKTVIIGLYLIFILNDYLKRNVYNAHQDMDIGILLKDVKNALLILMF